MKRIENYFANKEISAIHLCENLQRIKKNNLPERINLTEEENNSLLINC